MFFIFVIDMKEIETRVRAISQDGLVWGACKYKIDCSEHKHVKYIPLTNDKRVYLANKQLC